MSRSFIERARFLVKEIDEKEENLNKWLHFWAEQECPYQVGDKMSIHDSSSTIMTITEVTARRVYNDIFEWLIQGVFRDPHSDQFVHWVRVIPIRDED